MSAVELSDIRDAQRQWEKLPCLPHAVAGAAKDAVNSEEAAAVVAAARSAGNAAVDGAEAAERLPCPLHTPWLVLQTTR